MGGSRVIRVDKGLLRRIVGGTGIARVSHVRVTGNVGVSRMNTKHVPELRGHFPGVPVVPGVVMLDAMFQTCAAMMGGGRVEIGVLRRAEFRRAVKGDESLRFVVCRNNNSRVFDACASRNDGSIVATAMFEVA